MVGAKTVSNHALKVKAVAVRFVADVRSLEIKFENGISYRYPVDRLDFSRWDGEAYVPLDPRPSDADLENVELWPSGEVIEFEDISQGFEVAQLVREIVA